MLKRILSLVTALCLLTLLCVPALAEEECDHVFNGDTCTKCGFVCNHYFTGVEESYFFKEETTKVIGFSEVGHMLYGTLWFGERCLQCGVMYHTEVAQEECVDVLDHVFENDVCIVCGYVKGDPIPTATPEPTVTPEPTATPEPTPTVQPTDAPTQAPTTAPTENPTAEPTSEPTTAPTTAPTQAPTTAPTEKPNAKPGKADVPKTGERSFAPAVAALMLCAAGALLLSRRK